MTTRDKALAQLVREVESQRHYEHAQARRILHPVSAAQHSASAKSLDFVHELLIEFLEAS